MGQIVKALEGIGEASRALDAPVTGGNVSLYNETDGVAIYPTPVIGVVGLFEDVPTPVGRAFARAGDLLLGEATSPLAAASTCGRFTARWRGLPRLDLWPRRPCTTSSSLVSERKVASAHDIADGGLAVALAECSLRERVPRRDFELGEGDFAAAEPARTATLFSSPRARLLRCRLGTSRRRSTARRRRVACPAGDRWWADGRIVDTRASAAVVQLPGIRVRTSDTRGLLQRAFGLSSKNRP